MNDKRRNRDTTIGGSLEFLINKAGTFHTGLLLTYAVKDEIKHPYGGGNVMAYQNGRAIECQRNLVELVNLYTKGQLNEELKGAENFARNLKDPKLPSLKSRNLYYTIYELYKKYGLNEENFNEKAKEFFSNLSLRASQICKSTRATGSYNNTGQYSHLLSYLIK